MGSTAANTAADTVATTATTRNTVATTATTAGRAGENRRRLALALRTLLDERPLDTISLEDVLHEADLASGSFYHLYRSRDAFCTEALGDWLDEVVGAMRDVLREAADADGEAPDTVRRLIGGYWALVAANRGLFRTLEVRPELAAGATSVRGFRHEQSAFVELAATLRRTPAFADVTPERVELAAHIVGASVQRLLLATPTLLRTPAVEDDAVVIAALGAAAEAVLTEKRP